MLIRAAISSPDFDILTAASGEEALAVARENSPLELVVTDVMMPGIDGFELASRLSEEGCASRFLFVSGFFDGQEADRRMEGFGCSAFLQKPFTIPDLVRAVKTIMAEKARLKRGVSIRERFGPTELLVAMDPVERLRACRHWSEGLLAEHHRLGTAHAEGLVRRQEIAEKINCTLSDSYALMVQIRANFRGRRLSEGQSRQAAR